MRRIQGFVWMPCRAVTADFEFLPRQTRQNGKCQGLVSFVISRCAESLMEEVIALARLLGCVEAGGTDCGNIALKARSLFNTAVNYLIFSA